MKQNRTKNNFMFVFTLLILCLFVFGGLYLYENRDKSLTDIIDNISNTRKVIDSYNGVYSYKDKINGTKTLFEGCMVNHFSNYILIVNDDFFVYRSSCVGTFMKDKGKTKDLNISVNEENKEYYIKYNEQVYYKNHDVTSIEPSNLASIYKDDFYPAYYQLLFKESQFEGEYYNIFKRSIKGLNNITITFEHLGEERFLLKLNGKEVSLYNYTIKDFDTMPDLRVYGKYFVVIEKDKTNEKHINRLRVFDEKDKVFDLSNAFPIVVDDVVLNETNSIFITYNEKENNFTLLIGDDLEMCVKDSNSKRITYYEFSISYNHRTKEFEKPVFVKKGYEYEGCNYVDGIIGG